MPPHCFDEIQITAEILYYRSPMILSVFGNLLRNEEMRKESQKNPQISTLKTISMSTVVIVPTRK